MFSAKAPSFWSGKSLAAISLLPLSGLWWLASKIKSWLAQPQKAELPVICAGNLVVGGSGKTPFVLALCSLLAAHGWQPVILSRGHGGQNKGPLEVDPALHDAGEVGDEPLLMAGNFPVVIARQRALGAAFIARAGLGDVIIMDDGLQNTHLQHDVRIAVFDGEVGIANGWLLPAGPMRTSLSAGMKQLDLVLFNGADATGLAGRLPVQMPQITARLVPYAEDRDSLQDQRVFAFAGIGRPQRFFNMLAGIGADLAGQAVFGDHHPYSEADLTRLSNDAHQTGGQLVTTHKDWVRLPAEWRERVRCLSVWLELAPADKDVLVRLITEKLKAGREGKDVLS